MSTRTPLVLAAALLAAVFAHAACADRKTVCTITVNSANEREVLRRNLPSAQFDFVELVERGRSDWLESACRKGVRCDVLLISGHFDGGDVFYTDRLDSNDSLPVDELKRVSCSDSCPGLFSQLKEVYLFGCNTLNTSPLRSASAEIARSLVRSGHSPADAEQLARVLNDRHGESNRDVMRQIFKDVPVIYGFSSKAPLGAAAGPILERYLQSGDGGDVGSGRPSAKLLALFAPTSMTAAVGVRDSDPDAGLRRDVCHFSDDRLSESQKIGFVHELLTREAAEARMFLDSIEKYSASLRGGVRQSAAVAQALDEIARDRAARERYMEFARDADDPAVRARMIEVAHRLGWLSQAEKRAELLAMMSDQLSRNAVGTAVVDLVCSLNKDRELDQELPRLERVAARADKASHAAVLACLGDAKAHARVLRALTSASDDDVQIAEVYLRHRPMANVDELRAVTTDIARMKASDAQVRALDTLARQHLQDGRSLDELTRLFPAAKSVSVQRAIAGILIRADYRSIAAPELVRALRQYRLKSPDGEDVIDILIRRLQLP